MSILTVHYRKISTHTYHVHTHCCCIKPQSSLPYSFCRRNQIERTTEKLKVKNGELTVTKEFLNVTSEHCVPSDVLEE